MNSEDSSVTETPAAKWIWDAICFPFSKGHNLEVSIMNESPIDHKMSKKLESNDALRPRPVNLKSKLEESRADRSLTASKLPGKWPSMYITNNINEAPAKKQSSSAKDELPTVHKNILYPIELEEENATDVSPRDFSPEIWRHKYIQLEKVLKDMQSDKERLMEQHYKEIESLEHELLKTKKNLIEERAKTQEYATNIQHLKENRKELEHKYLKLKKIIRISGLVVDQATGQPQMMAHNLQGAKSLSNNLMAKRNVLQAETNKENLLG